MIDSSRLTVALELPQQFRAGLNDGTLQLFGGIIRDNQGRIRALLTEGRELAGLGGRGLPLDASLLTDALGSVQTAVRLANGLGILNLAVSAAGFAMAMRRLDGITDQLKGVLEKLEQMHEDIKWIRGFQIAELLGSFDSAIDMAIYAHRLHDRALFIAARRKAFEVRRILHRCLHGLLESGRALKNHEDVIRFMKAISMLAIAQAKCDEAVEGSGQARRMLHEALRDLSGLVAEFDRQRSDFSHNPVEKIQQATAGRKKLSERAAEMSVVLDELESAAFPFLVREALNLTTEEWQKQTAPPGSGLLTCLMPPAGMENDMSGWLGKAFADNDGVGTPEAQS